MVRDISGTVFHIMRFGLQDGPGIRTTVFLKGCPLACWWCHNPESQDPQPNILYSADRCLLCGKCVAACPEHGLRMNDVVTLEGTCRRCGTCAEVCPPEARRLAGTTMTVAEVLAEIERDVVFYDESGGGVTFSGGEPLQQPVFLMALLEACRERGIHTAIETCGAASPETLLRAARAADLVLYDLKLVDAAKHQRYTGVSNRLILDNLARLSAARLPVVVRIPVVPGINDAPEDIDAMAEFLAPLSVEAVNLLPYHATGSDKYRRLGLPYLLEGVASPSSSHMNEIAERLRRGGVSI